MRVDLPSGVNLVVWKRAIPRNRMREIFTSGSVGGLVEQSPILPGRPIVDEVTDPWGLTVLTAACRWSYNGPSSCRQPDTTTSQVWRTEVKPRPDGPPPSPAPP